MTVVKLTPDLIKIIIDKGQTDPRLSTVIVGDEAVEAELLRLRQLGQDKRAAYTYHAYGKPRGEWTLKDVRHILNWCETYHQALALWENSESGIQLFCIKDPAYGHEEVGMSLYEYMQGHYESYGLAHWTEWEILGLEIDTSIPAQYGQGTDSHMIVLGTTDGNMALLY